MPLVSPSDGYSRPTYAPDGTSPQISLVVQSASLHGLPPTLPAPYAAVAAAAPLPPPTPTGAGRHGRGSASTPETFVDFVFLSYFRS